MTVVVSRRNIWIVVAVVAAAAVVVLGLDRSATPSVHAAPAVSSDSVTVTGVGSADGAPDSLGVDFQVRVTRSSVQGALDAQGAAARRVLAALQRHGVARADMRTTDLSLDRHYDNRGDVTGYDAAETVHARLTPLRGAGATISAVATSSGNDVTVGSLSFDLVDDDAVVKAARSDAYGDARNRAQQYADLAGRSLGRVQRISEQVSSPPPVQFYGDTLFAKTTAGAAAAVPIRGGRQTLTVRVTVVWSLR